MVHCPVMELDELTSVLDRLTALDPAGLGDGESVERLFGAMARLESVATTAVGAFDAAGAFVPDGAQSAAAWVATRCRLPKAQARRAVRRGRALRHLPVTAEAWAEGSLTGAHVDTLAGLRRPATEDALARDESLLVDQARTLRYEAFVSAGAYWAQLADPDGVETEAEATRAGRDVYLVPSFGGGYLGRVTLDPVSGAIVADELGRLERSLFEADWAAAEEALHRPPTSAELGRTSGQRRADALVEMATRSRTAPADGKRPAPLFSVLVDLPTLTGRVCELAQGQVLTPGSLLPWLEGADLERAVFAPPRRVEVSATARLFTGATRRAIVLRDRVCTHPYCDVPASACQADHIGPYADHGPTTQENGQLRCGFHNRLRTGRPPPGRSAPPRGGPGGEGRRNGAGSVRRQE